MSEKETMVSRVQDSEETTPQTLVGRIGTVHVTALAWGIFIGLYGYIAGRYGSDIVTPEHAWLFMAFGIALGVAMAGSVVMMGDE